MNHQLSLKKIIATDYLALLTFSTPIVSVGLYLILLFTGEIEGELLTLLLVFGGILLISILLFMWRISIFTAVFNEGVETQATIGSVFFFRRRGRVSYSYIFQGQQYKSLNIVIKNKSTRKLQGGSEMVVLVDRSKPNRAFLRDLYVT